MSEVASGTVLVPGEVKEGKHSTEWKIALAVTVLGLIQMILGAWVHAKGGSTELTLALEIIGSVMATAAQLGYTGVRGLVKATASKGGALVAAKKLEAAAMIADPDGPSGG